MRNRAVSLLQHGFLFSFPPVITQHLRRQKLHCRWATGVEKVFKTFAWRGHDFR